MKPAYFLMRHGYAGEQSPDASMDRARHLTPLGKIQAASSAVKLANKNKQPTAVYCDADTRCLETAQIVADQFGFKPEVEPRLAGESQGGRIELTRQAILDHCGGDARPLFVTHHDVICQLQGDVLEQDIPAMAEIRRMHGKKEKRRIKP